MNRCLIYFDEEAFQDSIDLLEAAKQIYQENDYESYAVCFHHYEAGMGHFNHLISVCDERIDGHDLINMTSCMEALHKIYSFDYILIPATYFGRMLAPRLAMRLGVGLVADVTEIGHTNGETEMVRPAYSGKLFAGITKANCTTVMMSVRPNVFHYTPSDAKNTQVIQFKPAAVTPSRVKLLETTQKEKSKDIQDSAILISGGGGVLESFRDLYPLADELNAMVSASRKVVDSGTASRNIQVGHSGKTVSPKLYIALGIYGSVQHIEGLKAVESIISVNVDKDAPICSISDIVVEGDAVRFVEMLLDKIRTNKRKGDSI